MRVFLDSSALAKRYVAEPGSDVVFDWCARADELCVASIAVAEIVAAFCRLRREGRLGDDRYQTLKGALLEDLEDALLCDVTPSVLKHSVHALESSVLRGMDAIHVGCARAMDADVFVTSDQRQAQAARGAGLRVEVV